MKINADRRKILMSHSPARMGEGDTIKNSYNNEMKTPMTLKSRDEKEEETLSLVIGLLHIIKTKLSQNFPVSFAIIHVHT